MRSIVRTMLAAAAGASLVASGTTAALWTAPALAGADSATVADADTPERAGLVPRADDRAPSPMTGIPATSSPQTPTDAIDAEAPSTETSAPTSAESAPATERRTAPDRVAAPSPATRPSDPAPAPAAPAPGPGADDGAPDDGADNDGAPEDRADEDDSSSLLGGLTDRIGVSCAGLLVRVCD